MKERSHLFLGASVLGLLAVWPSACTSTAECFVDSDCGSGEICDREQCVNGNRHGDAGGDGSGDAAGDGPLVATDDYRPPSDETGPIVIILEPKPFVVVKGVFALHVYVFDPDGLASPPKAVIAETDVVFLELEPGADEWMGLVPTDQLRPLTYAAITVTAVDIYGNQGGDGIEVTLDSVGPAISFTTPDRQYKRYNADGAVWECSQILHPLGPRALKHGDVINPSYFFGMSFFARVHVQDRANDGLRNQYTHSAGVDEESLWLVLLDQSGIATGQKLVLGTNGECDRINPALIPDPVAPSPNQAILQRMVPVSPRGAPDFSADATGQTPATPTGAGCDYVGIVCDALNGSCYTPPGDVCGFDETPPEKLTMWIGGPGELPEIYVVNAWDFDDAVTCKGGAFDVRNFSQDGPACIAAVGVDGAGNIGVSKPIVICVDRDNSGDCSTFAGPAADATALCTDGCFAEEFGSGLADPIEWAGTLQ
jgi:hypothetical protein